MQTPTVLFDFNQPADEKYWTIVDDVVMGGRSNGDFSISEEGYGVFSGEVSLENNGGFSSVRCRLQPVQTTAYNKFILRVKGDGKSYQFRVKAQPYDRHSYIYYFQTTGAWQVVEIPMSEMYPTFRGRRLAMPNYSGELLAEMSFLIGNKQQESFVLFIDKISLE